MPSFENSIQATLSSGAAGRRANMEEWNTITRLAESTDDKPILFGAPVERAAASNSVRAFATGKFLGIAEADISLETNVYPQGANIPVMTMGVIFVPAGGVCTPGGQAKWDAASGLYSDTGTTLIPDAEFDSAAEGNIVKLRLMRTAGKV